MRNPNGYAVVVSPAPDLLRRNDPTAKPVQIYEGTTELDTFQCGHCGSHLHIRPGEKIDDLGGFCRQCMKAICPMCLSTGRCDPLEKKLARAEAKDRARRSYGI